MNTILNRPNHLHVSTERLNRQDSQLAVSLEGESIPTLAVKTLPHSYPKTKLDVCEILEILTGRCNDTVVTL